PRRWSRGSTGVKAACRAGRGGPGSSMPERLRPISRTSVLEISGSLRRSPPLIGLGAFCVLAAQAEHAPVSVSGRALRGGRDTVPLANTWVVLHRLSRDSTGPLDSVRSDGRGRYRLVLRNPDSTSQYAVSVWYDSIAYFSLPLNVTGRPVHVEDLVAFATTSTGPPIGLARRLATVARAGAEGTREVLEILELENTGATTRVTTDPLAPTWAARGPA